MATVVWYLAAMAAMAHLITSFECPELRTQALIPDPDDCRKYYHCLPGKRVFPMQCPSGLVFDRRQKVCVWDSNARSCAPDTELEPIKPWQPSDSSVKESTPTPKKTKSHARHTSVAKPTSTPRPPTLNHHKRHHQDETEKSKPVSPQKNVRNSWTGKPTHHRRPPTTTTTMKTTTQKPTTTTTTTTTPPPTTTTRVAEEKMGGSHLDKEGADGVNLIGNILATLGFDVPSRDKHAEHSAPVNPDVTVRQDADSNENHSSGDTGDNSNDHQGLFQNREDGVRHYSRHRRSTDDNMIQDDVRCPSGYAYFPDPSSCSAFYHCYNWQPMRKLCPPGLFFDDQTYVCNWPHNVNCIEGYRAKTLYSFNELMKETRQTSKVKSKSLIVPKTFPTRDTTTTKPTSFRKPITRSTTTTSTTTRKPITKPTTTASTTTTTTTMSTTESTTTTTTEAPTTVEMTTMTESPATEITSDAESSTVSFVTSAPTASLEEASTPVRGFRGWRTTDYDVSTSASTVETDHNGVSATNDNVLDSTDLRFSGKPVWSRQQDSSIPNEKERSAYPFYNFNPVHSDEKAEEDQKDDVTVEKLKDKNSGYSWGSFDDAKDTELDPMHSPFASFDNEDHRRGFYDIPQQKNSDSFQSPERNPLYVPKERNIGLQKSGDWRTTASSFSWTVTSSLPSGRDIVKPELYASSDLKKLSEQKEKEDAEKQTTGAPATSAVPETSSTTVTSSEMPSSEAKAKVSSSSTAVSDATTTSPPAVEKETTSKDEISANVTGETEKTSTTNKPVSVNTTAQEHKNATQHNLSDEAPSSDNTTTDAESTTPASSTTSDKSTSNSSLTTAAEPEAISTASNSSTTTTTTTTASTTVPTTPVAFAAAKVPFYALRSRRVLDPTSWNTGRSHAASSSHGLGSQLRAMPHSNHGHTISNPYFRSSIDDSDFRSPTLKDFKNPEDVQIEKFMINLLNDAMRTKHVVSRDITGSAGVEEQGPQADDAENNDVITLGYAHNRHGMEEEKPAIPSLFVEVDPNEVDFSTTANVEDMRVSGKATPEMLASSSPSETTFESENIFQNEGLISAEPKVESYSAHKPSAVDDSENLIMVNTETDEVFDKRLLSGDANDLKYNKKDKKEEDTIISVKKEIFSEVDEGFDYSGDADPFDQNGELHKIPKIQAFSALLENADEKQAKEESEVPATTTQKAEAVELTTPTKKAGDAVAESQTTTVKASEVSASNEASTPGSITTTSQSRENVSETSTASNTTSKETTSRSPADSSTAVSTPDCNGGNCSTSHPQTEATQTKATESLLANETTTAEAQTTSQNNQTSTDETTSAPTESTSSSMETSTLRAEPYVAKDALKMKEALADNNNRIDVSQEEEEVTKVPKDAENTDEADDMQNVIDGVEPKQTNKKEEDKKETDVEQTTTDGTTTSAEKTTTVKVIRDTTSVQFSNSTSAQNTTETVTAQSTTENQNSTVTGEEAATEATTAAKLPQSNMSSSNKSAENEQIKTASASMSLTEDAVAEDHVVAKEIDPTSTDSTTEDPSMDTTTAGNVTTTVVISSSVLVDAADDEAQTKNSSDDHVDTTTQAHDSTTNGSPIITENNTAADSYNSTEAEQIPEAYLSEETKILNAEQNTAVSKENTTTLASNQPETTAEEITTPDGVTESPRNVSSTTVSSDTTIATTVEGNTTVHTINANTTTPVVTESNDNKTSTTAGTTETEATAAEITTESEKSSASTSTESSAQSQSEEARATNQEAEDENKVSNESEEEAEFKMPVAQNDEPIMTETNQNSADDKSEKEIEGTQSAESTEDTDNNSNKEETQKPEETTDTVTEAVAESGNTGSGMTGTKRSFVSLTDLITWYIKHWRDYSKWRQEQSTQPPNPGV